MAAERKVPMDGVSGQHGLRQGLESMVALEYQLEESLAQLSAQTSGYLEAPVIMSELHSLARGQREAVQAHLRGLGDTDIPRIGPALSAAFEAPPGIQQGRQGQGTVAALRALGTAFSQAALAYEVLHGVAHRFFHPATAELTDQHRRNYLQAAQAIHRAVGDVVVQELQEAGHACRCECPSCSPGICLCWHIHLAPDVTGPGVSTEDIVVRTPRAQSNAERAGLRHGDAILAVDGQIVRSYQDMLDSMRDHQPGQLVTLRVRRGTGGPRELVLTR
jgi:membrane-associated protease RseP (regulator of RpoE activity)